MFHTLKTQPVFYSQESHQVTGHCTKTLMSRTEVKLSSFSALMCPQMKTVDMVLLGCRNITTIVQAHLRYLQESPDLFYHLRNRLEHQGSMCNLLLVMTKLLTMLKISLAKVHTKLNPTHHHPTSMRAHHKWTIQMQPLQVKRAVAWMAEDQMNSSILTV